MTIEEKRTKYRAFYYKHHDRHLARARERENLERTNETREQRERRLTYLRGWQEKKRHEKLEATPIEDRPPNFSAMSPAQLHQFGVIVLALLESKHQTKLTHRRRLRFDNVDKRRLKDRAYREKRRAILPPRKPKLSAEELRSRKVARDRVRQKDWRKKLRIANPETYAQLQKKNADYERNRRKNDTAHNIACVLRRKVHTAICRQQNGKKTFNTISLVGCSIAELMKHVESQFEPGMSWALFGRGKGKFSLDHVRPLASYDLTKPDQQKLAFNWKNIAPKWFGDNCSKSSHWQGRRWRHSDHTCKPVPTA